MCTAVSFKTRDHYFGRTLDYERSYVETVTIAPRKYPFPFRRLAKMKSHYAIIGMAYVETDYPLYYDAVNEKGLCMAGLNFPDNAVYFPDKEGMDNVAPFEFIPWILGQCASLQEARALLARLSLCAIPFSNELPLSPLHWLLSDASGSIVVESVHDGLKVYDNPAHVLTNNPPFEYQLMNLNNYMHLSIDPPKNLFSDALPLAPYSRGMGAMGMPGDLSSVSRFIRAAFTRLNSICGDSETESVNQFFHILSAVSQQRGCVRLGADTYEITIYSSCCNANKGIYYYTTYENSQITGIDMRKENLDGQNLISYPLITKQPLLIQNG